MELPWFKIYAAETLSDESFQSWDVSERGAWFTLLCVNWREGSIPNDQTSLAKLLHVDSSAMRSIWSSIGSKFVPSPDHPGRLTSPRLELEREKAELLSKKKADAGRNGANLRWLKENRRNGTAMGLPSASDGGTVTGDSDPGSESGQGRAGQGQPVREAAEVSSRVDKFARTLADRLGVQSLRVGRDVPGVVAAFERQLDAVPEDVLLMDCLTLAERSSTGTPASLAWFVPWLENLPNPKGAQQ